MAPAPLRSPRKTSAPAAFAVGESARPSAWPNVPGGHAPDVLPPTTDHRGRGRRFLARVCVVTGGGVVGAPHRFGAGPPGLRGRALPVPPPGSRPQVPPRDRYIGWTPTLRRKNLPLVVDSPRFLILTGIRFPNLGSHILALVPPPPAPRQDPPLQHHTRPRRDLRRGPPLHRRRL